MSTRMSTARSESGFAMLTMMLALIVVGGLVYTATARTHLLARSTVLDRGKMLTFHAATGGLSHARHALRKDPNYRGEELVVGSCHVKIEITPIAAAARPETRPATRPARKRWQAVITASHQSFGAKIAPVQHRLDVMLAATRGLPTVLAFHDNGR